MTTDIRPLFGQATDIATALIHGASELSLPQLLSVYERAFIEAGLMHTQGNVSKAAKLLGINRTTLLSMMSRHDGLSRKRAKNETAQ